MKTAITILTAASLMFALWAVVETKQARELKQTLDSNTSLLSKQAAQTEVFKAENQRLMGELRVANERIFGKKMAALNAAYLQNQAQTIDARLAKEQADARIEAVAGLWGVQNDLGYLSVGTGQLKEHELLIEQSAVAR
jgi:vancomycin resistance protein YoaR